MDPGTAYDLLTGAGGALGVVAVWLVMMVFEILTPTKAASRREAQWKEAFDKEHEARLKSDAIAQDAVKGVEVTNRLLGQIKDNQTWQSRGGNLPTSGGDR